MNYKNIHKTEYSRWYNVAVAAIILFSTLFLDSYFVLPGLSVKVLMSILVSGYILLCHGMNNLGKGIKLYIAFLCIYSVCNIINGEFGSDLFLRRLLALHITCIIAYCWISTMSKKGMRFSKIQYILLIFYLFDVVVTILQYYNNPIGWAIGYTISPNAMDSIEYRLSRMDDTSNMLNLSITNGITSTSVANGYFLATFLPVVLVQMWEKKNVILNAMICIVSLYAIFCTQQRMAFMMASIYMLYLIWRSSSNNQKILLVLIGGCLLYFSNSLFESIEMGRLSTETSNDDRLGLFEEFSHYIDSNVSVWGGEEYYRSHFETFQHNTFLGAWIIGGVPTFIFYTYFILFLIIDCFKKASRAFRNCQWLQLSFSMGCLIYIFYSFTHSSGIHNGAMYFWILYSLLESSIYQTENIKK